MIKVILKYRKKYYKNFMTNKVFVYHVPPPPHTQKMRFYFFLEWTTSWIFKQYFKVNSGNNFYSEKGE